MADLLLLNASNQPAQPIYPYAFVQLGALARHAGLRLATADLLGVAPEDIDARVADLVARERPRLVGIHLRQVDSLIYGEYATPQRPPWRPLDRTADLVRAVRRATAAPLVVGGFGFSTQPRRIFDRLQPDLGVAGEPDELFARFDDVVAGRTGGIANLVTKGGEAPRRFFAPSGELEYDDAVVTELERFYGASRLYADDGPAVAVELARGCPYRCYFCTEPDVKGRRARVRDLDVVFAEIERLAARGLRRFWLVCSEINLGDSTLAVAVAERFVRLNEGRARPVRWHAYHLPRWFSRDDLALMYRSGFAGGWNDVPSFDDENLARVGVPYRARHALEHFEHTLDLQPAGARGAHLTVFFGNAHATPTTVQRSLRAFEESGLAGRFQTCEIMIGTRWFESGRGAAAPGAERAVSYGADGPTALDPTEPTFYLSPAITDAIGPAERQRELFGYVARRILSTPRPETRPWEQFLVAADRRFLRRQIARIRRLRGRLPALPALAARVLDEPDRLDALLEAGEGDRARRRACYALAVLVGVPAPRRMATVWRELAVDEDASTYAILAALLPRFPSIASLIAHLRRRFVLRDPSRELWVVRRLLFQKGVVLDPTYRVLVGDRAPRSPARTMTPLDAPAPNPARPIPARTGSVLAETGAAGPTAKETP